MDEEEENFGCIQPLLWLYITRSETAKSFSNSFATMRHGRASTVLVPTTSTPLLRTVFFACH